MVLFNIIAAIIIYLPIVSNGYDYVTGYTFTYTEGATCTVIQRDKTSSMNSNNDGWCVYSLNPGYEFTVTVSETSDNPLLPGAMWFFTCMAQLEDIEYPQRIYGVGCQR